MTDTNRTPANTGPVTDYVYCANCGIDLPRPPPQMTGSVLPCPCCDAPLRLARAEHIWCDRVSVIEANLIEMRQRKAGQRLR